MRLSVQIEFDKTLDLETYKSTVVVGRSPQCDLVIPHDSISRQHCKIEFVKGHYYITDLDSSNGVSLDGQKIEPRVRRGFLTSQVLALGTLECEVSESKERVQGEHTIVSSSLSEKGDFTATIRLARLDLNKPSKTLEMEKKIKVKGPRNPVAGREEPKIVAKGGHGFKILIVLFTVAVVLAAWFLAPSSQ